MHAENLTLIKGDLQGYIMYPTSGVDLNFQAEKIYKTRS